MGRCLLISLIVLIPFSSVSGVTLSAIKELKWTVMKQQVSSIEFEGLSMLLPKDLEEMSQLRPQQVLSIPVLNKDVERLVSTGYFKSVRYELIEKTRWVKVRYILEENKPINDIQIKGVTIFKHDSLKKSLKSKVTYLIT